MTYFFRKTDEFNWDVFATVNDVPYNNQSFTEDPVDSGIFVPDAAEAPVALTTLTFDTKGKLVGSPPADTPDPAQRTRDVFDPRRTDFLVD